MAAKIIILIYSLLSLILFISCASSKAQLSAPGQLLLNEYSKAKEKAEREESEIILPEKTVKDYSLKYDGNDYIANAFITVNEPVGEKELIKIGGQVNSKINNIWSITFPLSAFEKLILIHGVEFIEISYKVIKK